MTTIITRLFPDAATAKAAAAALQGKGLAPGLMQVFTRADGGSLTGPLRAARVSAAAAAVYDSHLTGDMALLVVRAPFAPMGTARMAMKTVDRFAAVDVGLADENQYIREEPQVSVSGKLMPEKTFFMSNPYRSTSHGHILGSNPISPSRPRTSAIRDGAYMSTKFWPMKLLSRPKEGTSAIRGGFLFSSMFGLPTLLRDWGPRDILTKI